MADYDSNRIIRGQAAEASVIDAGLRAYMLRVYNYMLVGLGLTAGTAWLTANTPIRDLFFQYIPAANAYGLTMLGMIAIFAPLALVLLLSFRINRMSVAGAQTAFWVYASLVGISVASILLNFTGESVARVFGITAATFGAMSLYGYTTKRDLTGFGSFLFMGLIGVIIASLVNMFLHSSMMQFIISVIGVLVFTGLTAYDTQKIKNYYVAQDDGTVAGKKAIMGALNLYLDFINLFFMLIQLFGSRR
jgi:uncharacterized protein